MRGRTVLLAAVGGRGRLRACGSCRSPSASSTTFKDASARREAELREAVEVAVETDATSRAPRHAAWAQTPDLDVDAGWDRSRERGAASPASALGADDPGRSLTPEEARALLLDPTGERAP